MELKLTWDNFFKSFLKLPEERKVEIAKLVNLTEEQAREHPKYFTAQILAIMKFIEKYKGKMPKKSKENL